MRIHSLLFLAFAFGVAGSSAALADTTVTITTNGVDCKVPPPDEVAAPATPSAAAGMAAQKNRNYALARANFRALAEGGDPEGERLYGLLLLQKCTGLQDKGAAVTWLTKAVDGGNAVAQVNLGDAYMNGEGVAQDDGKAFALLSKAAAGGLPAAEVSLGYLYFTGRGVPADRYQGMVWTVKAGEQGLPAALMNIANGYLKGNALPQDNDRASYFLALALERSTPAQKARMAATNNNIIRAQSANDTNRYAERARRWSPGPDSLSDVLRDAARRRDQPSKG